MPMRRRSRKVERPGGATGKEVDKEETEEEATVGDEDEEDDEDNEVDDAAVDAGMDAVGATRVARWSTRIGWLRAMSSSKSTARLGNDPLAAPAVTAVLHELSIT